MTKTIQLVAATTARGKRSIIANIKDVVSMSANNKSLVVSVSGDKTTWFIAEKRSNEPFSLRYNHKKYDLVYINKSVSANKDHIKGMTLKDGCVYVELSDGTTHKVARRNHVTFKRFYKGLGNETR